MKFAARIIAIRVRGPTLKILDAVLSALNKVELDSVSVLDDTSKLLFTNVIDTQLVARDKSGSSSAYLDFIAFVDADRYLFYVFVRCPVNNGD